MEAFDIDTAPVTWAQYLPFVQATGHRLPLHVRCVDGAWQQHHFGSWLPLHMADPAVHLSHADAQNLVPMGGPQTAHRGRVAMCRPHRARLCLGPGVGMDEQPVRPLPRL